MKLIRKTGTLGVHPKHNWLVGGTARGTQDKVVGDSGGLALGTRAPAEGPPIASTEGGIFARGGLSPIFFRVFVLVPGPREVLKVLYCGLVTHTTVRTLKAQEGVLGYLEIRYLN